MTFADTSIAAFLTGVLRGGDPAKCTALAAAEGACSVTAYDALSGLKSIEELAERIESGWETLQVTRRSGAVEETGV